MDPNPANNNPATDEPNFAAPNPPSMGLPPEQPISGLNPQPQPTNPEMANDLGSQAVGQQASGMPIPNIANDNQPPANNFAAPANDQALSGLANPATANQPTGDILSPGLNPAPGVDQSIPVNPVPAPDVANAVPAAESTPIPVPIPGAQSSSAQQPLATGSSSKSTGKSFWLILGGLLIVLVVLGVLLIAF